MERRMVSVMTLGVIVAALAAIATPSEASRGISNPLRCRFPPSLDQSGRTRSIFPSLRMVSPSCHLCWPVTPRARTLSRAPSIFMNGPLGVQMVMPCRRVSRPVARRFLRRYGYSSRTRQTRRRSAGTIIIEPFNPKANCDATSAWDPFHNYSVRSDHLHRWVSNPNVRVRLVFTRL